MDLVLTVKRHVVRLLSREQCVESFLVRMTTAAARPLALIEGAAN
jgi:hypothetical protein